MSRLNFNQIPSVQVRVVDPQTGLITQSWAQFFSALVSQPGPIAPVAPTGSPFSYVATQAGSLSIAGGAVSSVTLNRGRVTITLGANAGVFPMAQGDTIKITYTGAPTLNFIPG